MFQKVLERSGRFENILEDFKIIQKVLECSRLFQKVLERSGRFENIPECHRMFQNILEDFIVLQKCLECPEDFKCHIRF
jgi:hypothetical protein